MNDKLRGIWTWILEVIGLPTLIVGAVLLCWFGHTYVRDWRQQIEIAEQNRRMTDYERQTSAAQSAVTTQLLAVEKTHQTTLALLDTLSAMNGNLKELASRDEALQRQTSVLKTTYENSRNGKITRSPIPRDSDSLRQYEESLLANDRKLYPDGNRSDE